MFTKKWANIIAKKYDSEVINEDVLQELDLTKGYCPCIHPIFYNKDFLCPCREMREENYCRCRLFKGKELI